MDNPGFQIGAAIKKGLAKKRISQKELGHIMGVGKSTVSSWIKGSIIPPGDKLLKIIKKLEIVDEFFPEYEKKNIESQDLVKEVKELRDRVINLEDRLKNLEKKLLD